MRLSRYVLVAATLVIAACSNQTRQTTPPESAPTSAVSLQNPTDFPLVAGAKVVDVKPFTQTVTSQNASSSGLSAQGSGTYSGHELLAASPASPSALAAWLASVETKPPSGYAYEPAATSQRAAAIGARYGMRYAVFRSLEPGKKRGVVIVVMDPATVRAKLGYALDLVDKYRALPDYLRKPVDDQLKARTGMSATEATDPSSPLGMTISAVRELQSGDQRAIVLVDAAKE